MALRLLRIGCIDSWAALRAAWPSLSATLSDFGGHLVDPLSQCRIGSETQHQGDVSSWSYAAFRGFRSAPACAQRDCVDYGQPSPETHPELFAPGDLTPGIPASEYSARRSALLRLLPSHSAALLSAAPIAYMAGVIPYPYRPSADFLYLTGNQQPGGVALLEKTKGVDSPRFAMFMPPKDVARERWDGPLADVTAADAFFGANEAHRLEHLDTHVGALLARGVQLFYDGRITDPGLHHTVPQLRQALEAGRVRPLRPILHGLRWRKSAVEIEGMRAVSAITAAAFKESMRASLATPHEHAVAATFEYECKKRGAQRMAYPPVVGAGRNGCYIHYSRHDKQ